VRADGLILPARAVFADGPAVWSSSVDACAQLPFSAVAVVRDGSLFVVRRPSGEAARFVPGVGLAALSAVAASPCGLLLALARSDGTAVLARVAYAKGEVRAVAVLAVVQTVRGIAAAALSSAHFALFAAARAEVVAIDVGAMREIWRAKVPFAVARIAVDDGGAVVVAAGADAVAVLSVSGEVLIVARMAEAVTAVAAHPGAERRGFVTGHATGAVRLWGARWAERDVVEEDAWRPAEEEILAITVAQGGCRIVVGTRSDVFVIETREASGVRGSPSNPLIAAAAH
jgi:hypothetical protein